MYNSANSIWNACDKWNTAHAHFYQSVMIYLKLRIDEMLGSWVIKTFHRGEERGLF